MEVIKWASYVYVLLFETRYISKYNWCIACKVRIIAIPLTGEVEVKTCYIKVKIPQIAVKYSYIEKIKKWCLWNKGNNSDFLQTLRKVKKWKNINTDNLCDCRYYRLINFFLFIMGFRRFLMRVEFSILGEMTVTYMLECCKTMS